MTARDARAEALEAAGLYRRAARRWLEVFDKRVADAERDWLRQRRMGHFAAFGGSDGDKDKEGGVDKA